MNLLTQKSMRLLTFVVALAVCQFCSMAALADDDQSDREEEMFGGSQDEVPPNSDRLLESKLAEVDDFLDIGGDLYMRLQYYQFDKSSDGSFDEYRLASPNLLHLYLDGRPNDHLRAFVRGRLQYDFTVDENDPYNAMLGTQALDVFLDQLWLKFDIGRVAYITVGRQVIRWGSGRFWNPTDFLNQQHRDPLATFDERLGVSLIKVHIPVESLGWNFYAVANLDGATTPEEVGGALRAEFLFGSNELAVSAAYRKDQPLRLGLDISSAVWEFDLRVEAAVVHGDKTPYWRGRFDMLNLVFPEEYSREDDWIPQLTAGAEVAIMYSDQDSLIIGVEYFYNDATNKDSQLYTWLLMQGNYMPFYLGQHYASGYLALMQPGDWNDTTFFLSGITNMSDGTWIARLDYQVRLLTYLQLSAFATFHFGDYGEFRLPTEIPAIDEAMIPESTPESWRQILIDGLSVPAQRFELGIWLKLDL
ncbi:MAG: hypothetical protein JRJ87_22585 [Deltaproteobacteria bacterium]|nr:hypothetical protein [Deltaproteobacteria bacterium]